MKKIVVSIMIVFCAVLLGILVLIRKGEDDTAPEIVLPDTQCTYIEGGTTDALLEGVSAYDDQDGDVTQSVQIEAIRPLEGGSEAMVIYVAKDKSNNIASASRVVDYVSRNENQTNPLPSVNATQEPQQDAAPETESPVPTDETGAAETDERTQEQIAADEEAAAEQAAQEAFASLPAESPRLTMQATAVTVTAGSSFAPLNYVKEITDDKDTRDDLYHRIQIRGDYDMNVPGTYELTYYVTDSDQNQSNTATLMLTVTE